MNHIESYGDFATTTVSDFKHLQISQSYLQHYTMYSGAGAHENSRVSERERERLRSKSDAASLALNSIWALIGNT